MADPPVAAEACATLDMIRRVLGSAADVLVQFGVRTLAVLRSIEDVYRRVLVVICCCPPIVQVSRKNAFIF
jgi:hypothetical protein